MLSIITNINALAAQSALAVNQRKLSGSMERLSTGLRINSAKDDSAGLGMSMRMTAEIRGLYVAVRNTHDAISAIQTADSGLSDISNALQRIRELAVQAATDTVTSANRIAMNNEASQMVSTIDQVVNTTSFNNIKLLDGSFQGKHIQIGTGNAVNDSMTVSIANSDSGGLNVSGSFISLGSVTTVGITALAAGELTINTTAIGAASTASAKDVTAAINLKTAQTGVTAVARRTESSSLRPIQSVIDLVSSYAINGKLIAPIQVDDGKVYYLWDMNGDRSMLGFSDTIYENRLDSIFNQDINGVVGGSGDINETYRYANFNGIRVALPTLGDNGQIQFSTIPDVNNQVSTPVPGTAVGGFPSMIGSNAANSTYNDLIAMWDAYNGKSTTSRTNGVPPGWSWNAYQTATPSSLGHFQFHFQDGLAVNETDTIAYQAVALEVLNPPSTFTAINSDDIQINGINIGAIGAALSASERSNQMVTAINAQTGNTGVNAVVDSATGGVKLNADDGRNIEISILSSSAIAGNEVGISLAALAIGQHGEVDVTRGDGTNATVSGSRTVTTIRSAVDLYSATNTSITVATSGNGSSASGLSAGVAAVSAVSRLDLTTATGAGNAIVTLDAAIRTISNTRSSLGAYENALTHIGDNLDNMSMNMSASRSRILDTDYAIETSDLARSQILSQASTAILAQANQNQKNTIMALIK